MTDNSATPGRPLPLKSGGDWQRGLNDAVAAGRNGMYRPWVGTEILQLATTVWRGHEFVTAGEQPQPLASLELPDDYTMRRTSRSWTGETREYRWGGDGLRLDLRTTLPGPLLRPAGRTLRLRWAFRNAPDTLECLAGGTTLACRGRIAPGRGQVFLANSGRLPTVLAFAAPVESIEVVSHEHWTIVFAADGGALLWVPLLDVADRPGAESLQDWIRLARQPPLQCEESYRIDGDTLHLRQHFPAAALAPLPPLFALLDRQGGGLLSVSNPRRTLLKTLIGPYCVADGDAWTGTIALSWRHAELKATRPVRGPLAPIPDELVYAGDVSWAPGTPMDQLLALRVWAPLAGILPPALWQSLAPQLQPPAPDAFKASLATLVEPVTGRAWSKDANLFGERSGDVSYDADWYNGLTLSGLFEAQRCADPRIAARARQLAAACRPERERMVAYLEIAHDWALGAAWSDPRGEIWDLDCAHDGMEGLLAEARLREQEGDAPGRDRMLYLVGKSAAAFLATYPLAAWCRDCGFVIPPAGDPPTGTRVFRETRGALVVGVKHKSLCLGTDRFPAYHALLRQHGPVEALRTLARMWKETVPERYADWVKFYTGFTAAEIAPLSLSEGKQERRIQAAVFYHLAPEIALRLWVLDEAPDEVEALYRTPLNLPEQILCRAGVRLGTCRT